MRRFKSSFKKNIIFTSLILLVLFIFLLILTNLKENSSNRISIGGSFILTDQNGQVFDSSKFRMKKLIYFGYTFCPDVCPFDLLKLSKFLNSNPNYVYKFKSIFVTIDPDRDGIKSLSSYLENFNSNIVGLTGTNQQIDAIKQKFRIYVKKNKTKDDDKNYLVDHTTLFFLMDENDNYITHFRPDDLSDDLQKFL
tara:strand:+ start:6386 stop:6970 length:585 start_codon:yes stop_codon:yes gene_type:complete